MNAEADRSVNNFAELRKDGAGECQKNNALCRSVVAGPEPMSSWPSPGNTKKLTDTNDDSHLTRSETQKHNDLAVDSAVFDGDEKKTSLQRCNSDTSYSSMEVEFLLTASRHVSGSSAQNLELNAFDAFASPQPISDCSNCGPVALQPEPDLRHETGETVCPADLEQTTEQLLKRPGPVMTVPDREEEPGITDIVQESCAVGASADTARIDQNAALALQVSQAISEQQENVDVCFSETPIITSQIFSGSDEAVRREETGFTKSLDLPSGCKLHLSDIPRSWSTPAADTQFEKQTSKADPRSPDPIEALRNSTRPAEDDPSFRRASSSESGPMTVSGDGLERAKDILGHGSDSCVTPVQEPSPRASARASDGTKAGGDLTVNGSSGKAGKSSSDKKKRGLSWYSVLSPTYKSRSDDFKRIFKDIPSSERLIVDYSCALQKDILVHGRLYISQSWICFYANIFRWETMLTIDCKDVIKLSKERTARVIPNAIQICTKDEKYFFTSFGTRDKTYLMLDRVWKNGQADEAMSRRELWQWVHYSYGEELGLTSGDEDYIPLSAEEKINFQTRVQKEESKLQKLSQRNDNSAAADAIKDTSGDYLTSNGELLQPSVEDMDSSVADNLSVTSADDSIYAFSEGRIHHESLTDRGRVIGPCTSAVPNGQDGVVSGDISSEVEEEDEVSTGDEDVDRCAGHAHFGIDVVDENLNIPIDALFEHCFTDSPLYREFVKNKKTFDVVLSPWPEEADVNGVKVRNIAYTLSLGYSIGPKYSPSTERQIMHPETRPGHFYLIDTECINGGIPYGENFYIVNRYCISKVSSTKSHLRITSELRYRKSVWGFVRNFIDKNATAGLIESFNVMADLLRQESDRQAQLVSGQTGTVGRRKYLRRRRVVDRSPAKLPLVDVQHPNTSKQSTPVKHFLPKASAAKAKEDWHVKLTIDVLVRIVCAVLILLMVFNAILFYKLWSLEATAANVLLSQKPARFSFPDHKDSGEPDSNEDWASLLNKQRILQESEIKHWKEILSTSIQLMDEMIEALTDLRSSIDSRSLHKKETHDPEPAKLV